MRHYGRKRRRFLGTGNTVMHVPSTMAGVIAGNAETLFVLVSPSILAGGSATTNIEAQDKDRTVNVGHHVGTFNIDTTIRGSSGNGVVEYCVFKAERQTVVPLIGVDPIPSGADITAQGLQQACRLMLPGKVFHFSKTTYTLELNKTHRVKVSPAKFKLSKLKAGDHWLMLVHNRGGTAITFDFEARYKEYE